MGFLAFNELSGSLRSQWEYYFQKEFHGGAFYATKIERHILKI